METMSCLFIGILRFYKVIPTDRRNNINEEYLQRTRLKISVKNLFN